MNIRTYDSISARAIEVLQDEGLVVDNQSDQPVGLLLRSNNILMQDPNNAPASVLAVGRAGSGVDNIPVQAMSERGILVFNAPGANANSVAELTIALMLVGARNIVPASHFMAGE